MAQGSTRVADSQTGKFLALKIIELRIVGYGQQYAAAVFEADGQTGGQVGNRRRLQAIFST
ncbi:hypothetical protein D3C81_1328370 [compost metagenome]